MADQKDNLNREQCTIGMSPDGEVIVITIPIKKYANNQEDGAALLFGKFRELEAHARQEFKAILMRKAELGLVRANGAPPLNLKVN